MLLCLLINVGLFLIAQQPAGEPIRKGRLRWFGVYIVLGLTWLGKFHYGAVMVLAPAVVHLVVHKRCRDLLHLANPLGLIFLLACVLVWPSLVLSKLPNAMDVWTNETVGRATGATSFDRQPFWYYLPHVITLGLPAVVFAVRGIRASWRIAWNTGDERERFLWIWLLSQLAIVTILANKHPNYILPALPVLSLLGGRELVRQIQLGRDGRLQLPRWASWSLCVTLIIATAIAYLVLSHKWPHLQETLLLVSTSILLGGVGVIGLLGVRRPLHAGIVALSTYLLAYCLVIGWVVPGRDYRRSATRFAQEVRTMLPHSPIHVYAMGKAPVVFYLESPVFRSESTQSLLDRLKREQELFVVTTDGRVPEIAGLAKCEIVRSMQHDELSSSRSVPTLVLVHLTGERGLPPAAQSAATSLSRPY